MTDPGYEGESTMWTRLDRGNRSGVRPEEPDVFVLDDTMALQRFWLEHTRDALDAGSVPEVDLEEYFVLAVCLGERATGGFDVEVREVRYLEAEDTYVVEAVESTPDPEGIVTQALTAPYDLVQVLRVVDTPPMARLELVEGELEAADGDPRDEEEEPEDDGGSFGRLP